MTAKPYKSRGWTDKTRLDYWRKHSNGAAGVAIRMTGHVDPQRFEIMAEGRFFIAVPIDGMTFWGFWDVGLHRTFVERYPVDEESRAAKFDPATDLNSASHTQTLFDLIDKRP